MDSEEDRELMVKAVEFAARPYDMEAILYDKRNLRLIRMTASSAIGRRFPAIHQAFHQQVSSNHPMYRGPDGVPIPEAQIMSGTIDRLVTSLIDHRNWRRYG